MLCWCLWPLGFFVVYKLLDWLIRKPFVGKLNQKYVFITGCDSGFGSILARRLDAKGCHVFAGCLTEAGETALRKACSSRLTAVPLNVTSITSIEKAFDVVKAKIPAGTGLWSLHNNAGLVGKIGPAEWLTEADFQRTFSVNLFGLAEVTRVFMPLVKAARGRIVNTTSVAGRFALPLMGPYNCSKFAVEAYSDTIRREMRPYGITVHIIEPGFHKTSITDPDISIRNFTASWNQTSQELKDDYGQQYLDKFTEVARTDIVAFTSDNLEEVVDAYEHAAFAVFPRKRYQVGKDSRFLFIPLSMMPEWVQDNLLPMLTKKPMIPQSCKK